MLMKRGYLADAVFTTVGAEILRGDHPAGAVLPSERLLAERFGVSKLIVRQAVHRLAEAGLVEARQGGATRVRDAAEAADLRVIELYYRLAPDSDVARDLARHVLEKQFTQGMSLVVVFGRRASARARKELEELLEETPRTSRALADLETRFWTFVANAGGNRILAAEVRWWYGALAARPEMPTKGTIEESLRFYRELARRLRAASRVGEAVSFYLSAIGPAVDALFEESPS
jgi:DNA-binding FadR family transcriptional regulator